jgi:hypothetical protein
MATASGRQTHTAAFPYAAREGRLVGCLPRDSVSAHATLPASIREGLGDSKGRNPSLLTVTLQPIFI